MIDFLEEEFDEILSIFQVESEEIISRLNHNLLDLEKKPNNKDAIFMLFRDAHSLKGASRMIGFNNIQTLAHKIEDILGFAKDSKIKLNTKTVNILYKTVDLLSEVIHKSIENKKEVYSEDVFRQISILESIANYVDENSLVDEKIELDADLLAQNIKIINNLISESLFILMKIERDKNECLIGELLEKVKELYGIFQKIGFFEIKQELEDISVKLEFVNKASHNLNESESEAIHNKLSNIIATLMPICEIYNLETEDYYSLAFEKMGQDVVQSENKPQEIPSILSMSTEVIMPFDLALVNDKFSPLNKDNISLAEIKAFLRNFELNCLDASVNHIIGTIIKIIEYAETNEMQIDEETALVIKESLEYCDDTVKNKSESNAADKELILQRLEIVQQILEMNTAEEDDSTEAIPQKGNIIKNRKIKDFSTMFNSGEIKTLRVDSSKLDTLVNQIGELIITKIKTKKHLHELNKINKNMAEWQRSSVKALKYLKYYEKKYFGVHENADNPMTFFVKQFLTLFTENNQNFGETILGISELYRTIQEDDMKMNLIVSDLEQSVKNIRVLPLATIFHLFGRMVRDIAQEKGKEIDLEIIGSDTSTDKKIIEEIKTPLIHIIRNAIDHGIETPKERIALGKNPVGKIILSARQVNNNVIIEIKDDGKGINIAKIKEKALSNGYLRKEELNSMTDEQITNIIFAPGFSTGEEITNISGRGIGLDVVQTKISQLNGKVMVFSEINKGCCVQIELPTTMSTLKAFLVQSSNQTFAIPMTTINSVVWKKTDEIFSTNENKSIIYNEKTIPLYSLTEFLNLKSDNNKEVKRETVLIIQSDNKTIGLVVDKLIGDQEILHKKLSAPLYRLKNISGITTLASGEICLILNVTDILKTISNPMLPKINEDEQKILPKNKEDYKILVVDDSITTRTLEKNILTKAGYKIEIAINPIEAFEKMKNTHFDLIISDLEMPEMDGFEFLNKLKTDEMYFEIPFIIVSSKLTEENKKQAKDLGAIDYIVKNEFNQDEFLERVNQILSVDGNSGLS